MTGGGLLTVWKVRRDLRGLARWFEREGQWRLIADGTLAADVERRADEIRLALLTSRDLPLHEPIDFASMLAGYHAGYMDAVTEQGLEPDQTTLLAMGWLARHARV